jgi:hypothetical protein
MRNVALPALLLGYALALGGGVTTASATADVLPLNDAVERLRSDYGWAGPQRDDIVVVYADLKDSRVKVIVRPGTDTSAIKAAAKRTVGSDPKVVASSTKTQPLVPPCDCLKK